ncbi:PKD domain-containing protein [bacterium]|nr:PKD domain-containing protein [bacterium]
MNFEFVNVSSQGISVEKRVFLDGEAVIDDEGIYHFKFTEEKNHELKIVVEDTEKKLISEKIISIIVKTPDLDCFSFSVTPDQGYEPLKVTLDASKVKLKDPDDSAVYFSFDFGDGEKKENVTNGIMSHTYKYDFQKENGEFSPTVTVRSRKGLTCTQKLAYPIIVKKELVQIELTSPTHPTQIAKVGKTVGFYAEFNGYPETMTWNFGDGTDEYTCKGRNCTEVTHEF